MKLIILFFVLWLFPPLFIKDDETREVWIWLPVLVAILLLLGLGWLEFQCRRLVLLWWGVDPGEWDWEVL